ncbi:MAG: DUF177 domain-containing protein [Dehalococcoidia bacterium]
MLFNVATLLREPVGSTRKYTLEPEEPIHRGAAELLRVPTGVLVRVDAEVLEEAACSRCLSPFAYRVQIGFEEIYHQQVDLVSGGRMEEPEDPDAFRIDLDNTIDIKEAVRQYSEVAAEMQPLCRPDCPGICAVCGQDLNIGDCSCDRSPIDSRWAALAALRRANG